MKRQFGWFCVVIFILIISVSTGIVIRNPLLSSDEFIDLYGWLIIPFFLSLLGALIGLSGSKDD